MATISRLLRSKSGMGNKPFNCRVSTVVGIGEKTKEPYGLWINIWRQAETGRKRQTLFLNKEEMEELYQRLKDNLESK